MPSENGIVVLHAGEGRRTNASRVLKAGLEHGQDTLTLMELYVPPGDGSPPHIHHNADESWYVLEGELTFYSDEWSATVGPGAFVLVPRGTVHNYRVTSETPARYLEIFTPAGMERFFDEIGALRAALGDSWIPIEEEEALWRKHGMTLLVRRP